MKTKLLFAAASLMIIFASCSSTKQVSSGTSDDLYITKTESTPPAPVETQSYQNNQSYNNGQSSDQNNNGGSYDQRNSNPGYSTSDQYQDSNGTTYITNN